MDIKRTIKRELLKLNDELYLFKGDMIKLKNHILRKLKLRNTQEIKFIVRFDN